MMAILTKHRENLLMQLSAESHLMKILFTIQDLLLRQIRLNSIINGTRFVSSIQRHFSNKKMKQFFPPTWRDTIKDGQNGINKLPVNSEIFPQVPILSG